MDRQIALDITAKQQANREATQSFIKRIARILFHRSRKEPVERNPLTTEQKTLITNLMSMH